jgi:hypothetical protein
MTDTQALIDRLAADVAARPGAVSLNRALIVGVTCAAMVVLLIVVLAWGPRPDLALALLRPAFQLKLALGAALAAGGYLVATRLIRPDAGNVPIRWFWLGAALVLILLLAGAGSVNLAAGAPLRCVAALLLLSLAPLAVAVLVLRRGASVRPSLTGFGAGLMSGGIATLTYSLYCPVDTLGYVALWYGAGILGAGLVGGGLGRLLLRW